MRESVKQSTLRDMFLDALESAGYNVIGALEEWNAHILPELKALPTGKHVYNIGKREITLIKE